jgi:hypothetical protein
VTGHKPYSALKHKSFGWPTTQPAEIDPPAEARAIKERVLQQRYELGVLDDSTFLDRLLESAPR